jgi:lipid A 3-O-deacylase
MARFRSAVLVLISLSSLGLRPEPLVSQTVEGVRLEVDNDNFNFWTPRDEQTDFEYTHGARLEVDTRLVLPWSRRIFGSRSRCFDHTIAEPCALTTWGLTHRIYTPRTNSRDPVPAERPYSGWLGISATAHSRDARRLRSFRTEVGVTGPPSLGEFSQRLVHRLGHWWEPLGWAHQIGFEPGVHLEYEEQLRRSVEGGGWTAEVVGRGRGSLGSVRTGTEAALQLRAGHRLPHPWQPDRDPRRRLSVSVFASAGGEWVLRDLSLDGTLLRSSPRVDKLPFVGTYSLGTEAHYQRVTLGLRVSNRSRAYRTEPGGHQFTTVLMSYSPR